MGSLRLLLIFSLVAFINAKLVRQNESAIDELERYIQEKKSEINQRYRLKYHVSAPVGWINDPNGFSFYKGEYHLFYQFYPYDSVWGPMHWGHVVSPDLVKWLWLRTALLPEEEDCFSGSAVVDNDTLVLMYTANIEDEHGFEQTQYLAFSDDGERFTKYEGNPVIPRPENGSAHFRDPKTWRHGDYWYTVIGSRTEDNRGTVLLYRSPDLFDWEFLSPLGESNGTMGYMWECPDFFELDGRYVLLLSPEGMEPQGDRYKNSHVTGYIIGSFNYTTYEFTPEEEFQELDYGHDFYAAQTMEKDGKRYLVGWFNMWGVDHPENVDGWAGALTLIRELKLSGSRLLMKPLDDQATLRYGMLRDIIFPNFGVIFTDVGEITIEGNLDQDIVLELTGQNGGQLVWLRWNSVTKIVSVDRGNDDVRQVDWNPIESTSWRIFLDSSTIELFCGEGEVVFSSRAYPDGTWVVRNRSAQALPVTAYQMSRSIPV